jgi:4'-phosphopantetheinyl transferase
MLENSSAPWPSPPAFPALPPDELHVWSVGLDEPGPAPGPLLSDEEHLRARAYHFENTRRRFIAARAALRRLLGAYLGRPPAELPFTYGPFGKPALADCALQFNVSHSGPLALIAIARHHAVGVDLEAVRDLPDLDFVEASVFAPGELAAQRARLPADRRENFYRRWTRREAFGKGAGVGLFLDVAESIAPPGWQSEMLSPAPGYAACVAWEGEPLRVRRFRDSTSRDLTKAAPLFRMSRPDLEVGGPPQR